MRSGNPAAHGKFENTNFFNHLQDLTCLRNRGYTYGFITLMVP
jgi:hypothetical protein